ncbi:hypothetical protein [Nakamurella leprariae]|uniref:SDR family NAD(P)-dependent oxidoreductase n=1 Tax=Nakamurella leprariae TaxID=2803911 RepID=A0A939C0I2_9ACTN|nr:hypothetical protein [Nakamurella leprariae]MBM9466059.1 hypothetical protein [Nakamurella leprariae]
MSDPQIWLITGAGRGLGRALTGAALDAGLEGFSEAMAAEDQRFGIRVTVAEVGGLDTEWATSSMQFSRPDPADDDLREAAHSIVPHVADSDDDRLRLLVGDDAPGQVAAALGARIADDRRDQRFSLE